jgi:hypothetical protein
MPLLNDEDCSLHYSLSISYSKQLNQIELRRVEKSRLEMDENLEFTQQSKVLSRKTKSTIQSFSFAAFLRASDYCQKLLKPGTGR